MFGKSNFSSGFGRQKGFSDLLGSTYGLGRTNPLGRIAKRRPMVGPGIGAPTPPPPAYRSTQTGAGSGDGTNAPPASNDFYANQRAAQQEHAQKIEDMYSSRGLVNPYGVNRTQFVNPIFNPKEEGLSPQDRLLRSKENQRIEQAVNQIMRGTGPSGSGGITARYLQEQGDNLNPYTREIMDRVYTRMQQGGMADRFAREFGSNYRLGGGTPVARPTPGA